MMNHEINDTSSVQTKWWHWIVSCEKHIIIQNIINQCLLFDTSIYNRINWITDHGNSCKDKIKQNKPFAFNLPKWSLPVFSTTRVIFKQYLPYQMFLR